MASIDFEMRSTDVAITGGTPIADTEASSFVKRALIAIATGYGASLDVASGESLRAGATTGDDIEAVRARHFD
ncbi:MAG: hypothetical protein AAF899_12620 [Pseudomonadota bacterium]